jgi:hypothetical protein
MIVFGQNWVGLGYYGKGIYFLEIQTGDDIINKKIILK